MKHYFKHKSILIAVLMAVIFGFTSCADNTAADNSQNTAVQAEETNVQTTQEETVQETPTEEAQASEELSSVSDETGAEGEKVFTLEELSQYNGQDGMPAYVAVDGVVYDVSGISSWSGGKHNGNLAGQDLSEAILKAPHGKSKLNGLPVVGTLAEE